MCLDVVEMGDGMIVGVVPESVLLAVRCAENVVANELDSDNQESIHRAEDDGMNAEVLGLYGVDEGNPNEVTECKHEAEAVCCQVHGREDCWLVIESIEDVPALGEDNNDCEIISPEYLKCDVRSTHAWNQLRCHSSCTASR